ncbi:hypothetical protein CCMSSC00406_0005273 [Pleurotus cornucopiae]|uniref:Uncharacterized protein n=1 Tax=Pleurotus cornucopiae TaxID=5321 RepID=A0ACB7IK50_PLECO|nr:hypothetical protein CCMSSC00406_0005273 [Pleurotus cornucopiae]
MPEDLDREGTDAANATGRPPSVHILSTHPFVGLYRHRKAPSFALASIAQQLSTWRDVTRWGRWGRRVGLRVRVSPPEKLYYPIEVDCGPGLRVSEWCLEDPRGTIFRIFNLRRRTDVLMHEECPAFVEDVAEG